MADASNPPTEHALLRVAEQALRARLPNNWTISESRTSRRGTTKADAIIELITPQENRLRIAVDTKRIVEPRDVPRLQERISPPDNAEPWDIALVSARYLSPSVRSRLRGAGLSYADATGNVYLRSDDPPLYIADHGLDRDPWRGPGRPRGTLKGAPAAQTVRALLDTSGPWKMRALASAAEAATGSVYRVVEFLAAEGLLVRNSEDATVTVPDWASVLRRWAADYEFLTTNTVSRWIAPRGIDSVIEAAIATDPGEYAVTGSVAAATWAPYAPARSIAVFSPNARALAEKWHLRETDVGANVLIAEPAYSTLMRGARQRSDGLVVSAPAQVAADLLTGPGRAPSEAEELIDWMAAHEPEWR